MRTRIVRVALVSAVVAVLLLGVPLAVVISRLLVSGERNELEREALRAAVSVSPSYAEGDQVELPTPSGGVDLGVYDLSGARIAGTGPSRLDTSPAPSGTVFSSDIGDDLVVVLPVTSGERVIAEARASSARTSIERRVAWWWLGIAGLAGVSMLAAWLLARWQGARLVRPLSALRGNATRLGEGDFSVRSAPAGVVEIDDVGAALDRTAGRLESTLERERSFTAWASHQLRTPLTRLQLEIENDGDRAALQGIADQLALTVEDVLAAARPSGQSGGFALDPVLEQLRRHWHAAFAERGRPLRLRSSEGLESSASEAAVRQVVQVLLDNALRHGRGEVVIHSRSAHGAVAIDVTDEGTGPGLSLSDLPEGGLGLRMALSLALAERGRLLVERTTDGTRFTLLLPA
ncbi:MAG: ATP-binding protein [Nocardioides sp.]